MQCSRRNRCPPKMHRMTNEKWLAKGLKFFWLATRNVCMDFISYCLHVCVINVYICFLWVLILFYGRDSRARCFSFVYLSFWHCCIQLILDRWHSSRNERLDAGKSLLSICLMRWRTKRNERLCKTTKFRDNIRDFGEVVILSPPAHVALSSWGK